MTTSVSLREITAAEIAAAEAAATAIEPAIGPVGPALTHDQLLAAARRVDPYALPGLTPDIPAPAEEASKR